MKDLRLKSKSLMELLETSFQKNWDHPAYSDYGTDTSYTYADAYRNMMRLHAIFKQLGIQPGDKVALCDKNSSRWAISMMAILTYGAVGVPILPDFSIEQIQNIYTHSESKLMISGQKLTEHFPNGMDITNFSMNDGTALPALDEFATLRSSQVKFFREFPDDLAIISYTSGSTGHSKGVMLPYRSLWSNALFVDEYLRVPNRCDILPLLPMSHMLGFAFEYMFGTCVGAHIHFLTKIPSPKIVLTAFAEVKPIMLVCVPLVIEKIVTSKVFPMLRTPKMRNMLRVPGLRNIVFAQIRKKLIKAFGGNIHGAVIGGAAMSREVEEFLHKIKFPYTIGYGMTECGPLICYEDFKTFPLGSCGRAINRMEVKIDSHDPENKEGEILVRGTNVMLGYFKNQEETDEAIDSRGWLHTGDLATMDKHGFVYIRGRKKSMLLGANGQNIYPEEIEDIILTHTSFDECIVVQREDKLVALVYMSEKTMKEKAFTRDIILGKLDYYRKRTNELLPRFAALSSFELRDEEFEKTPKRSVRRYLYK